MCRTGRSNHAGVIVSNIKNIIQQFFEAAFKIYLDQKSERVQYFNESNILTLMTIPFLSAFVCHSQEIVLQASLLHKNCQGGMTRGKPNTLINKHILETDFYICQFHCGYGGSAIGWEPIGHEKLPPHHRVNKTWPLHRAKHLWQNVSSSPLPTHHWEIIVKNKMREKGVE